MMMRALRVVAFRCPGCGEIGRREISRFQATGMGGFACQCDCGFEPLHVNLLPHRLWLMDGACPACEGVHTTYRPTRVFWNGAPVRLACPQSGTTLALLGEPEDVAAEIQKWNEEVGPPPDGEGDANEQEAESLSFLDPDAMSDALAHLEDLAAHGKLRCSCGNPQLRAELFADEVSVHCPSCGASVSLPVARRADVPAVQSLHEIELMRGGVAQLITERRDRRPPR